MAQTTKESAIRSRRVSSGLFESTAEPEATAKPVVAPVVEQAPDPVDRGPSRRRTYLLSDETVLMLGDFQAREHRRTRVKPDLSEIVDDAIREYVAARLEDTDADKKPNA